MGENESMRKGAKIRLIELLCMIIGFILLFGGIFFGNGIISGIGFVLLFVFMALYAYDYLFVDSDYYTYDFGVFSTKIHNAFSEKFKEVSPDSDLSLTNCKIKKFENSCDNGEHKYEFVNEWQGNRHFEKYEKISTKCYFEINYMEFGSEKERLANENKIKEHFKENYFTTKYFSSKNVQIVFKCYTMGYSTYLKENVTFEFVGVFMDLKEVKPTGLLKKASKNVVLK